MLQHIENAPRQPLLQSQRGVVVCPRCAMPNHRWGLRQCRLQLEIATNRQKAEPIFEVVNISCSSCYHTHASQSGEYDRHDVTPESFLS